MLIGLPMILDCRNCGICCTSRRGPNFKVALLPNEVKRFREFACPVKTKHGTIYVIRSRGRCVFLDKKTMRCKIYRRRPFECRIYPVLIDSNKKGYFLSAICPKAHSVSEKDIDSAMKAWKSKGPSSEWIRCYSSLKEP
jgi:Fe-S-cluster containining protein